jgi:PhoH-like ATPase
MKKIYVLDTNVLLSDPTSIFAFQENDLFIPMAVLEELDKHKSRPDEVGRNAREISRTLDRMREDGSSLIAGVALPGGGVLRVISIEQNSLELLPVELQNLKVDNMIIAFMLYLKTSTINFGTEDYPESILVSKDINVRIKCDSLGIKCEDYLRMRITDDVSDFYKGVDTVEVDEDMVDNFYRNSKICIENDILEGHKLYPNQIVIIKNTLNGQTTKSAITKYVKSENVLIPLAKIESAFGLKPRNKEQSFSLDLLFDDNIKLLTLCGPSGCGKTILALAAGLEQLRGIGNPANVRYDKLVVTKPIQPVGKEIGFLPGFLEEKMSPWIAPIKDNLNYLMGGKHSNKSKNGYSENGSKFSKHDEDNAYLSLMMQKGLIEVEAITFIRGRSIPNALIILDESQNLSMHEIKTIITRAGEGTKIIMTGDTSQIDNTHVDIFTNGLTYAVEKFKDQQIAGHITLIKGERSSLATIASQIL